MVYDIKEARPAPKNVNGVFAWLRDNLFSSYFNSFLTLLGIYFLYLIIPPFIEWAFINGNFDGHSKADCIKDGACWVFIKEKILMFMYGFYPDDKIYRVNIAYILVFVSIFIYKKFAKSFIQKLSIFLLYPIVAFILVRGGMFGLELIPSEKWGGLMLTLIIASVGIILSFPIGVIFAFGRQSKLPIIKRLSILYIEFIRGVPLITLLFMGSVVLPLFFPEGIDFDKLLRALIAITLFQAAYIAEVIRGGLLSIPKGQYEAADSLGLSYWQKMFLVILPQAIKVSVPNLVGASIALFKDTSLVLIIGLFDLLAMVHLTTSDSNWLGFETEGYVFVTFVFWVFCFSMSKYSKYIEKKLSYDKR